MTHEECILSVKLIMECLTDEENGERNKVTTLKDLKPSSFLFVMDQVIEHLEDEEKKEVFTFP